MLRLALAFLVIALLAALFGYGGLAVLSFQAAEILFFVFLVLALLTLVAGAARGKRTLREWW
jgi:uncharacterized membrane protein YtjA (UPF0391 family)